MINLFHNKCKLFAMCLQIVMQKPGILTTHRDTKPSSIHRNFAKTHATRHAMTAALRLIPCLLTVLSEFGFHLYELY